MYLLKIFLRCICQSFSSDVFVNGFPQMYVYVLHPMSAVSFCGSIYMVIARPNIYTLHNSVIFILMTGQWS